MYHHTEAERLLELCAGPYPSDAPELRAIGHALLAVADAIRDHAEAERMADEPIPFELTGGA